MGSKYKEGKKNASKAKLEEKAQNKFEFPSNVRQIGGINRGIKIYIEDYAYTYINKLGEKTGREETAVFLIGYQASELGEQILVISGAVKPPFAQPREEGEVFSEKDWRYAEDIIDKYFNKLEIVGWARVQPGYGLYLSASDISSHYKLFSSKHSVLFLYDPEEKLNCFFAWNETQDDLTEVAGYFVYYDKNQEMNAYIAETRRAGEKKSKKEEFEHEEEEYSESEVDTKSLEALELTNAFDEQPRTLSRSIDNAKRLAEIQRQKRIISMMTSVSVLLFFACVIMGIGLLQNGERISQMETGMRELRTGYNNIVTKLNDSVFPAFAAQTQTQTSSAAQGTEEQREEQQEEPVVKSDKETEAPSLDEALGVSAAEAVKEPEPVKPETYVVQPGDTLTYISSKFYGVPSNISKIMEANGMTDPNKLIAGTTLIIPMD